MRASLLPSLLGLSLFACTVGDGSIGGGGGGDDDVAVTCGNNAVDDGETCDDGNTSGGDGCSATCQSEPKPRLDVSVDKPTMSTELGQTTMITVTVTGSDGFAGSVTLDASVMDEGNAPLAAWTVTLDKTTLDVPQNGTATAVASLAVPTENKGLAGKVKVTATAAGAQVGTLEASTAVTAQNQVTIPVTMDGNGLCVYPQGNNAMRITNGTKVRFLNAGTSGLIIHSGGGQYGVPHQDINTTTAVNSAYERTVQGADGGNFEWYCHSPGPQVNNLIQPVP
jgi:cysteine-rich repeat protein